MIRGIVFGCYDPAHAGHIRLFRECKKHCDHLTVCVHDDDYIKRYKNRDPLFPAKERAADLADIKSVDEVQINPDRDRNEWVRELNVDIAFESVETPGFGYTCKTMKMDRTPKISSTELR